jgi:hypothetical protein
MHICIEHAEDELDAARGC